MNFTPLIPEMIVCLTALAIIAVDFKTYQDDTQRRSLMAFVAALGLSVALGILIGWELGNFAVIGHLNGSFLPDHMSWFFRVALLVSALLTVMISVQYVCDQIRDAGEFYALICLATLGGLFLCGATEMLTFYLSLELLSISSFVLVSLRKDKAKSAEAAIKYLIFGALSSGLLLYGLSLIFGATGSIHYATVAAELQNVEKLDLSFLIAISLIFAGLSYKIAAVPFHMWAPDVYEGAPIPVTAFLSSSSKLAGFAALLRVLEMLRPEVLMNFWLILVMILATASMTLGNLMAIAQRDIKRLFAYSSIAHAGYLLAAVVGLTQDASRSIALTGIFYYLLVYVFMNLGAFAVIIHLSKQIHSTQIRDFSGLGRQFPGLGFILSCCLLSLTGLPPFAGFTGKFYLFGAVISAGPQYTWLVLVGVINSVISLYYYSRIIKILYFKEADTAVEPVSPHPCLTFASWISFAGILGLFIFPNWVLGFVSQIQQLL